MDVFNVTLTERERNIAAYALAFYAQKLDDEGADAGYTGPLETAPECRTLEDRLRRAERAAPECRTLEDRLRRAERGWLPDA